MHNTSVFLNTIRRANYQRLGNSGFRVSVPILGGMSIGSSAWASWLPDEENVVLPTIALYLPETKNITEYCLVESCL